jgi:predicted RNA-binding Zn-ribbon protein involved in translation (DUF1610 family)
MENIPYGYDENGVRGGDGSWVEYDQIDPDICPECGSDMVWRNSSDFLICDNCGYEEVPENEMGRCSRCGADTPEIILINGLCPVCAEEMGII